MLQSKFNRLKDEMERMRLDALVATTYENVQYTGGFQSGVHKSNRHAQFYIVITKEDPRPWYVYPIFDLPSLYEAGVDMERVVSYGTFCFAYAQGDMAAAVKKVRDRAIKNETLALAHVLNDCIGPRIQRIGVDCGNLRGNGLHQLAAHTPDKVLSEGDAAFVNARKIKEAYEIEYLDKASEIADTALLALFNELRPGMTELEAATIYEQHVLRLGGENSFVRMTFGLRTAFVDTPPSPTNILQPNDIIRCDLGCTVHGYQSDFARTAVMGKASEKLKNAYNAILHGELRGLSAIKAGVPTAEIFDLCIAGVRENGLPQYARNHCGHSIGLKVNEPPAISADNQDVMLENMTFCIETPYYEIGWGGVQVEDTFVVTRDGYRCFTKSDRTLIEL